MEGKKTVFLKKSAEPYQLLEHIIRVKSLTLESEKPHTLPAGQNHDFTLPEGYEVFPILEIEYIPFCLSSFLSDLICII